MMRVSVFGTEEIKMMDDEGTSDVFIRCFFDTKNALETDTHYRCQTGKASFNYRLNFKLKYPMQQTIFTVQAYDRDFFKSNDIIGSHMIDLRQLIEDCDVTKRPITLNYDYYMARMHDKEKDGEKPKYQFVREEDKKSKENSMFNDSFWLKMIAKNDKGEEENNGEVNIRIDISPLEQFEKNPTGSARDDPNNEPYLPPPVGRLHFSLNPFEMYKQLIGPAMRRKIAYWCMIFWGSICCAAILYYLVPIIIGGLLTNWISHGF